MNTTKQPPERALPLQTRLTADDFYFDGLGNIIVDQKKIEQVISFQATKSNREPIKGGISPA